MRTHLLFLMLEDLVVWAGFGTVFALLIAWWLAPVAARPRLRAAIVFLIGGAILTTIGHAAGVRVVRYIGAVAIAVALVRSVLVVVFDLLPFLRGTPKIVRDINTGLVYFVAFMVVLRGFGVQLDSILTTSALLTAVVGFALQDTLGNLVAGLALQAQRPFSVGDWIEVEGTSGSSAKAGKVLEMNWRATKVVTLDRVEIIYPNSVLAKSAVTNFSLPDLVSRRNLFVNATYDHPPDTVCQVLLAAVSACEGVLGEPAPSVVVKSFDHSGPQYWVRYYIDDFASRDAMDGFILNRMWYALRREGIEIPYQTQTLFLHEMSDERAERARARSVASRLASLGKVDFLQPIPEGDMRRLAERARIREFAEGETVLRQGDQGSSFFVIREGELGVHVSGSDGVERLVALLGAGNFFGEMSLMTGEPRTATVRAIGRVELYEIDHEMFAEVLMGHGEIADAMSAILAQRQLALGDRSSVAAEAANTVEKRSEVLLQRIKRFFHL
ncbi:MAG: mechanosensitive ion channel family protein [Deltaproteobacteria bacterium]|nr:mechanosensitive ion channel family protein [Deltaproteobacteria bacterium]